MTNYKDLKIIVNDLYKFYRYFVASSFKENLPADHIKLLSKELMKMYRGDYKRLCVAQPPRTSKSSLITLTYPFWLITRNPKLNILIVTNSGSLSERFGIQLRELFNKYGELFNVKLSDIKHSSTYLMFTDNEGKLHSGSIRLVGAGGSITGQDADYIILDDVYAGFSDISPTLLQKKIDWFNTLILQRLEPHSRLLILHTRWHPISNDCPVLTTTGWKTHGELKVGDYVFNIDGKPVKVIKVHPKVNVDNCFEFANGDKIISGDHHLWNVYDWGNRKQRIMETHEIMERKTLVGKTKRNNFLVDNHEPLFFEEKPVPIDPYWFGLWLGDGHHKRPEISLQSTDKISVESTPYKIIRYDKSSSNCLSAFFTHQGLLEKLKELNVYGNKHIPNIYLYNSIDVRLKLLAGLIDSDGSVEKKSKRVVFVNTNKKLLKQVYELMVGLSFNVHVEKRPADKTNQYKKNSHSLNIKSSEDAYALRITPHITIPTKIPRKQITGEGKNNRIGLINKYKINPVEGNCITVESEDGMYLVGKNLTPTHNSSDLQGYLKMEDEKKPVEEREYKFLSFSAINPDGTCIWPERYTVEDFEKKREAMGERLFQALYQQKPLDLTSDFFNMSHLNFGLPPEFEEKESTVCRAWDIASSDPGKNDYTAGLKMYRFGKYAVIRDLKHGQYGSRTKKVIQETAKMDTPKCHVVIETGVAAAGKLLYEEWEDQLEGFIVDRAEVSGKAANTKADRATPLANAVEDGLVYIDIDNDNKREALLKEWMGFPNSERDDIVDASAHAFNYLFKKTEKEENTARLGVVFI